MKRYHVSVATKAGTEYLTVGGEDASDALDTARERVGDPTAIYSTHEWRT